MTTEAFDPPVTHPVRPERLADQVRVMRMHGHDRAYVRVGDGPPLLLLHGLGSSLETWDRVIPALAERWTVIAPDLLGHGRSDKPRADYSIGGYANGMRDLLSVLDIPKVTVAGHSFGGGVAMQFAYQYPEMCDRLILVGSGGLGPDVAFALRALTVPGSGGLLATMTTTPLRQMATLTGRLLHALPGAGDSRIAPMLRDIPDLITTFASLQDQAARKAFLHVLRAAVDPSGQVVTMLDRSYLADTMPVMFVWGRKDGVIPVKHAERGAAAVSGSRLVILEGAGHFPHRDQPEAFAAAVDDFMATTRPARNRMTRFRALLRTGPEAVSPA